MKKFANWLDETPGMVAALRKALGVQAAVISNVKLGRTPMPYRWFPVVARLSGGLFTVDELLKHRLKNKNRGGA